MSYLIIDILLNLVLLTSSAVVVLEASLLIALVVFSMDQVFQFVMEFVYPH